MVEGVTKRTCLDIVIVNWNSSDQLETCLHSIEMAEKRSFVLSRVVIVDNNSTDGSISFTTTFPFPLHVVKNFENKGFGVACNQGAENSEADLLLFLNPDVELYKDSLEIPMKLFSQKSSQDIGVLGIQLLNEKGEISKTCARIPSPGMFLINTLGIDRIFPMVFKSHLMFDWAHNQTDYVGHVMGAFYLMRRSIFEKLGGFDSRFFVYLEDLDLSCRLGQAGYKVLYLEEARAFHKGCGTSEQVKAKRLFYAQRSKIRYAIKHFKRWQALSIILLMVSCEVFIRIAVDLLRFSFKDAGETIKTYGMLYHELPSLLKELNNGRIIE